MHLFVETLYVFYQLCPLSEVSTWIVYEPTCGDTMLYHQYHMCPLSEIFFLCVIDELICLSHHGDKHVYKKNEHYQHVYQEESLCQHYVVSAIKCLVDANEVTW